MESRYAKQDSRIPMIEILVVDDQRLVRWCICAKINAIEGVEVTAAPTWYSILPRAIQCA